VTHLRSVGGSAASSAASLASSRSACMSKRTVQVCMYVCACVLECVCARSGGGSGDALHLGASVPVLTKPLHAPICVHISMHVSRMSRIPASAGCMCADIGAQWRQHAACRRVDRAHEPSFDGPLGANLLQILHLLACINLGCQYLVLTTEAKLFGTQLVNPST